MPRSEIRQADIAESARRQLGFSSLRPGQEQAAGALLAGRDAVFIAPAGAGKSAVCQLAGGLMRGVTVIVSPTIIFQEDQAEPMDAGLSAGQEQPDRTGPIASDSKADEAQVIRLAPEQLRNPETIERLKAASVSLFAVDQAHCISRWGRDFRPDYLELAHVIEALGHPPVLAMTANASNEVRAEIVERLGLRNPEITVRGLDRPNISLRVDTFGRESEKLQAVLRRVEFADKPGIVYVATHAHAESIAGELRSAGVDALAYHGGIKARDRETIQNRFLEGDVPVIVATSALGMGVDRPDIRFVYHADVSESLDAYYQEIGRAGRDGKPAEAVLFYRTRDISAQRYKTGAGKVDAEQLESVATILVKPDGPQTPESLSRETGIPPRKLTNILHKFQEAGAACTLGRGLIRVTPEKSATEIAEAALRQQGLQKQLRSRRLEQMRDYAETRGCRRECLLRYFGEEYSGPCGNCDRCEENAALRRRA
jgi:ATP-dependent DNA helicase RecQ